MTRDDLSDQVARYCDECEKHVAARVVGRLIKCIECGFIVKDHRQNARDVDTGAAQNDVRTDGGVARREAVGTTIQQAGVGDQDTTCKHGVEGCPGPAGSWLDSCVECFFEGGDDS